jgi:outer membrane protein TolC
MLAMRLSMVTWLAVTAFAVHGQAAEPKPASGPISPDDGTSALGVEDLAHLAVDRAPSVAALRARLASSREQQGPAGALPDPMVGVMVQSMGPPWNPQPPMSMAQLEITQTLPYPGKQGARRAAAEAETAVRAADIDALRANLATEVRTAYSRLYVVDQEQALISAAKEFVDVLMATAGARYGAGQGDIEAIAKIELERSSLDERSADVDAERTALVSTLNRLTGRDGATVIGRVHSLPEHTLPQGALVDAALANSPALRVARANIAASSRRLRAAETERAPNFVAGLAAGAGVSGDPIITLRFGAELPLWRGEKQEPMIRAAVDDAQAAREDLSDGELRIRADLERLVAQWRRDHEQIERYRDAIIPQSSVAFDAARIAYATGRGDFTTVVDDFRRWLDARLGLARREADRFSTWADVQSIIAEPPREGHPGDKP